MIGDIKIGVGIWGPNPNYWGLEINIDSDSGFFFLNETNKAQNLDLIPKTLLQLVIWSGKIHTRNIIIKIVYRAKKRRMIFHS